MSFFSALKRLVQPFSLQNAIFGAQSEKPEEPDENGENLEKESVAAQRAAQDEETVELPPIEWPSNLPTVQARSFFKRWFSKISEDIIPRIALSHKAEKPEETDSDSFSVRLSRIFNKLEKPFKGLSIIFIIWLLLEGLLFLLAFIPDLSDKISVIRQACYPFVSIVLAPLAIDYNTNWVAIRMLFHPRHKNRIWQGLIPARREELIEGIADGILNRLISPEIVRSYLHESGILKSFSAHVADAIRDTTANAEFRTELKGFVYGLVHGFVSSEQVRLRIGDLVQETVEKWFAKALRSEFHPAFTALWEPVLKTYEEFAKSKWGPEIHKNLVQILPRIPEVLDAALNDADKLLDKLPALAERKTAEIEDYLSRFIVEGLKSLDMKDIVRKQLGRMDELELEELLTGNVVDELVFIQVMGGVFGLTVSLAVHFMMIRFFVIICAAMITYELLRKQSKN